MWEPPPRAESVRSGRCRLRSDRGAATAISIALLTPLFVVLAFAAFQAAMWSHARTEARVVARDTATLVARSGVAPGDARASAAIILRQDTDLQRVRVQVSTAGGVARVTVHGDAPGILRGTARPVQVTEAVPLEERTTP